MRNIHAVRRLREWVRRGRVPRMWCAGAGVNRANGAEAVNAEIAELAVARVWNKLDRTITGSSGRTHSSLRACACCSCEGNLDFFSCRCRELARTQAPTTRNCTVELFAFGIIAGVSPSVVQCKSLALEEAPF